MLLPSLLPGLFVASLDTIVADQNNRHESVTQALEAIQHLELKLARARGAQPSRLLRGRRAPLIAPTCADDDSTVVAANGGDCAALATLGYCDTYFCATCIDGVQYLFPTDRVESAVVEARRLSTASHPCLPPLRDILFHLHTGPGTIGVFIVQQDAHAPADRRVQDHPGRHYHPRLAPISLIGVEYDDAGEVRAPGSSTSSSPGRGRSLRTIWPGSRRVRASIHILEDPRVPPARIHVRSVSCAPCACGAATTGTFVSCAYPPPRVRARRVRAHPRTPHPHPPS